MGRGGNAETLYILPTYHCRVPMCIQATSRQTVIQALVKTVYKVDQAKKMAEHD